MIHENNDGSLWDGVSNPKYGLGSIGIIAAVPVEHQSDEMDLLRVGIISGTIAYADLGLWDPLGNVLLEKYHMGGDKYAIGGAPIIIPEPATAALLAAGVLGILRRRR